MAESSIWMPFYIGDYLADTMHLDGAKHGAYVLLILHYWVHGPLPDDDEELASIARTDLKEWKKRIGPSVRRFFRMEDGVLRHKRIDAELVTASKNIAQKKAAANARWSRVESVRNAAAYPAADTNEHPAEQRLQSPSPSPSPRKKDSDLRSGADQPLDPKTELWREGLAIFSKLLGKDGEPAQKQLGKLVVSFGGDYVRLLAMIRCAEIEQPAGVFAWLRACANPSNGHAPDLFVNDPWGIDQWLASEPDVKVAMSYGEEIKVIGDYDARYVAKAIAEMAGFDPSWRGSWKPLGQWLREGWPSDAILAGVRKVTEWGGYEVPYSLAYFNKPVRESVSRGVTA